MSTSLFFFVLCSSKATVSSGTAKCFEIFVNNYLVFSHVMFKNNSDAMHVQPSLPEVGIHGEDGLPVGGKLGLRGVFGSTVLQRQDLE